MILLLIASPAWGQRVEARDGSIYLIQEDQAEVQLTTGYEDSDPSLSADGAKVAYVRSRKVDSPEASGRVYELHVIHLASGDDQQVLATPFELDGVTYSVLLGPKFSPDGESIYFVFDWSVTTGGIAVLDLVTEELRFVVPALGLPAVVYKGEYEGDLVVLQRRQKLSGIGNLILYYLFTPEGEEVGVIGDEPFDVGIFLQDIVGQ